MKYRIQQIVYHERCTRYQVQRRSVVLPFWRTVRVPGCRWNRDFGTIKEAQDYITNRAFPKTVHLKVNVTTIEVYG